MHHGKRRIIGRLWKGPRECRIDQIPPCRISGPMPPSHVCGVPACFLSNLTIPELEKSYGKFQARRRHRFHPDLRGRLGNVGRLAGCPLEGLAAHAAGRFRRASDRRESDSSDGATWRRPEPDAKWDYNTVIPLVGPPEIRKFCANVEIRMRQGDERQCRRHLFGDDTLPLAAGGSSTFCDLQPERRFATTKTLRRQTRVGLTKRTSTERGSSTPRELDN